MARYIDADAFEEDVRLRLCKDCISYDGYGCRMCWVDDMLDEIEAAPDVDIITSVEVKKIFDYLDRFIKSQCIEIKDEHGLKGYSTSSVHHAITEFKKKYTERNKK